MTIALPLIGELAVWLVVLWMVAIALAISVILGYVAGVLHGLPYPINHLAGPVNGLAKGISNVAYGAIKTSEKVVGASFHLLAQFWDKLWNEVKSHAVAIAEAATLIGLLVNAYHALKALVHHLQHAGTAVGAGIKTLEREYHGIEHRVKTLERAVGGGIGADVLPRIKTLEREVAHVEGKVIPAVEGAETALQHDVTALGEYIRSNFLSSATDAVTAAVAVALGALGLGGLRCNNFKSLLGKYACGLGSLLDDLLGIMIAGLALESVCEFLPLLENAFGLVIGPMVNLLNDVPLGACEKQPASWVNPSVTVGPTPPAQTLGTFGG